MTAIDYAKNFGKFPDEELIRISISSELDGFAPEAIAAAKEEIDRRGLSESDLQESIADQQAVIDDERNRHLEPLGTGKKIAFAFFAPVSGFVASSYGPQGYYLKGKQAQLSRLAGFAFWGVVSLMLVFAMSGN